ncbi:1643_t:CDS:2 [Diversispora eburnea]|uniref:1643_t:CDS:1 n=1 Tax=Diversispora eburnea TaxID=1213867 RepID=A0A9N8VRJ5_9GLOM|nr:1643_t:CDS:2 [Diversispora eburnea]
MEAINNERLINLQRGKRYMFKGVKGRPDVIRCSVDNKELLWNLKASQILSTVEFKTEQLMRTLIKDGTELFEAYSTALTMEDDGTDEYIWHQKIIKIIRQTFGYMGHTDNYASFSECVRYFETISTADPIVYSSPPNEDDGNDDQPSGS